MNKRYLITGGCGFLGSNLADEVLGQGQELCVLDNLSREGGSSNLEWLKSKGEFRFSHGDTQDATFVEKIVAEYQPDVIFHLAGQVAMTTSISDPKRDFSTNVLGTFNLLEAVRKYSPNAAFLYSSTNKVYGDLEWAKFSEEENRYVAVDYLNGFDEKTPLDFHSPYGCSKGAADQYILDYARIYGLNTTVFRHSTLYGGRQYATYDQGWIGWFCGQALSKYSDKNVEPFTISGNGKQVRDVLHADDLRTLYFGAANQIESIRGEAFNIGGGMGNSLSLLELFAMLENCLNINMEYTRLPPRESDQKVFVADISKAQRMLGWAPKIDAKRGVEYMLEWLRF